MLYKWVYANGHLYAGPSYESHYGILQDATGINPMIHGYGTYSYQDWACGYCDDKGHAWIDGGHHGNIPSMIDISRAILSTIS